MVTEFFVSWLELATLEFEGFLKTDGWELAKEAKEARAVR